MVGFLSHISEKDRTRVKMIRTYIHICILMLVQKSCKSETILLTDKSGYLPKEKLSPDCYNSDIADKWEPLQSPSDSSWYWNICNNEKIGCSVYLKQINIKPAIKVFINVTISTKKRSTKKAQLIILKDSQEFKTYEVAGEVDTTKQLTYGLDDVTSASTVQLAFRSQGFCGSLLRIDVYYFQCPIASKELVDFKKVQPAPSSGFIHIDGICVDNSLINSTDKPYMNCHSDGKMEMFGKCICKYGYTNLPRKCQRCGDEEYKPTIGNTPCLKCGAHSRSEYDQEKRRCDCVPRFYREIGITDSSKPCFEPPSIPRNISVNEVKPYSVKLQWGAPSRNGSSPLGQYVIHCLNCPQDYMAPFINTTTNQTTFTLEKLGAYAHYKIEITKENDITLKTGHKNSAIYNFTTGEGQPGVIRSVHVFSRSDGTAVITWEPPFAKGAANLRYIITYGERTVNRESTTFEIHPGNQDKTYLVDIRCRATRVDGTAIISPMSHKETVKVNGGVPLALYLIITFSVFLVITIALVTAFCVWKRRNPAYLQVVRMEDGSVKLPTRFYTGGSLYVDPKSYSDVDEAINDFAYEIDRSDLMTGVKIGDGEFADVYRGTLNRGGKNIDVAVKTLKPNATKEDRDDFLSEAVILGQFNDPNVIRLEGVVYQDEPNAIVLEYMVNGSLDKFLLEHDMQFTVEELLEMGRGVASGMKCLSEMGFVHRDLAARNILVNDGHQCKIADFGMSLELKIDDSTEEKAGKVPVRWTAPEAIQFKKFTTASDVWSYGVVLWEIMSYGERPYWDWSNLDVLEKVTSGYRLPPPMGCPRLVHDLMLSCWNKERAKRPLFSSIRNTIFAWLRDPKSLEDIAQSIQLDPNLDYTIMQTINKWLEAIGMGRYTQNFLEQGFATPRQILLLTMADIEALGVGTLEHQKKIHKAIERTRSQVENQIKRSNSNVRYNPHAR